MELESLNVVLYGRREWRILKSFGDSIMLISYLLDLPCDEVCLFQKNGSVPWNSRFLKILNIMKGSGKIVLHKVGELPPANEKFISYTDKLAVDNEIIPIYSSVDFDKVPYDKDALSGIDFEKTICWSARYGMRRRHSGGRITPKEEWKDQFVGVPEIILDRYPNYNFINLGMPIPIDYDTYAKEIAKPRAYDLYSSAWIIKKSYKYLGIDSGGTHFAITIKNPKNILFYNKDYPQRNPVMVKKFQEVGIEFIKDEGSSLFKGDWWKSKRRTKYRTKTKMKRKTKRR